MQLCGEARDLLHLIELVDSYIKYAGNPILDRREVDQICAQRFSWASMEIRTTNLVFTALNLTAMCEWNEKYSCTIRTNSRIVVAVLLII